MSKTLWASLKRGDSRPQLLCSEICAPALGAVLSGSLVIAASLIEFVFLSTEN